MFDGRFRPTSKQGSPIAPSEMVWHPKCWKQPIKIDAEPGRSVLYTPIYPVTAAQQLYDPECDRPLRRGEDHNKTLPYLLFPGLPVEPVCADAEVAS